MSGKSPEEKLEDVDGKVDELTTRVAVIDTRMKIGFVVIGALISSPKVGGPSAHAVAAAVLHAIF